MAFVDLQSLSNTISARGLRSVAPERGDGSAQPSAAEDRSGPAVVNHIGGGRASSSKEDPAEAEEVRKLQARDAEVRAHEQAHAAAGGALAGAPSFTYQRGPDGRSYAVGGEVPIEVSVVDGDPEATIRKMQQVLQAALAPQSPSDADRSIAASAQAKIATARAELITAKPDDAGSTPATAHSAHTHTGGDAVKTRIGGDGASASVADATAAGGVASSSFGALERRSAGTASYRPPKAPAAGSVVHVVS